MDDDQIIHRIRALVDEEHGLRQPGEAPDAERLREVEEMLDQCWDLLRQRRAKEEFGENPDEVKARDVNTVEHYRQ